MKQAYRPEELCSSLAYDAEEPEVYINVKSTRKLIKE